MIKCHQKLLKERTLQEDLERYGVETFNRPIGDYALSAERVSPEIKAFVKRYEWMSTWGVNPRWIFTARLDGILAGVECLNLPNAPSNLLGPTNRDLECLIQRGATASFAHPHLGSKLLMFSCRWMVANTNKRLFVAYSDPQAGEVGVIYAACNFEFLGWGFGTKYLCIHPTFKGGKPFSPQSLRRTGQLKKWHRDEFGSPLPIAVLNPKSGFKDMKKMALLHPEIKAWFYGKCRQIESESTRVPVPSKGKWALVLGKDRREQRALYAQRTYESEVRPRRDDPKTEALLKLHTRGFDEVGK